MVSQLLTESEVSQMTGLSVATLRNGRSLGRGAGAIPFIRLSARAIRYSTETVAAWIAARTVDPAARAA